MRTVAIRHVAFEDLGILDPILRARGSDIVYLDAWDLDEQQAEDADLLVFLGGPISVNDTADYPFLTTEIALAKVRIVTRRPTLGICLGAQIMACSIGGSVRPGRYKEIGWGPVSLTEAGQSSVLAALDGVPVLHWHGEICELPSEIEILAYTPECPVQAFTPGPSALALQFHVESGADGIEPWLVGHTGEISATPGVTIAELRADTEKYGPAVRSVAEVMFHRWFLEVGFGS